MIFHTDGRTEARLDAKGVGLLADTFAAAFLGHDNWRRVVPDPDARLRALRGLFGFLGAVANAHGHVVVTVADGKPVGFTTFMENRDRRQVTLGRIVRSGSLPDALRFLSALKPRELAGMIAFDAAIERFYRGYRADPSGLHLYSTGIVPELRGRGLMKSTFAFAERRLAAEGFTSYFLETSDPGNLGVYAAFGLERIGETPIPGSDRPVYFLERRFGTD